jgi:hypothetical protein
MPPYRMPTIHACIVARANKEEEKIERERAWTE